MIALWMLSGHMFGDWLLGQTNFEATTKSSHAATCLSHAAKWTIFMGVASYLAGWDGNEEYLLWLIFHGYLHALIDRRGVSLFAFRLKEWIPIGRPGRDPNPPMWLVFCIDQAIHIGIQIPALAWAIENGVPGFWSHHLDFIRKTLGVLTIFTTFVIFDKWRDALKRKINPPSKV